ncbi:MAG: hypothetical protein J7562_10060 [Agrobacterium tumefaciens]|nr:hypothetical protein [Agrobacterium tumefaciens]
MVEQNTFRNILIDTPSDEDQFHGKGHDRTATALANAIRNFKDADRAIGLDGPWGSGKSSVVGIAQRKLTETTSDGRVKFLFFTFDIWKSQGSAFRRSFLEHFISWAKVTFPAKQSHLTEIESKIRGKVREVDSDNQQILDWYGILILLSVPFLPIYILWTKAEFDESRKIDGQSFFCSWPMFFLYTFLALTAIQSVWKYRKMDSSGKFVSISGRSAKFRSVLSRTLLISAKQYEHQKVTQYIRETDPNDFEFQAVLREILSTIQEKKSRVIFVLDNIDRLPTNEIDEYWALVRSIFSRTHSENFSISNNHITAIVPYDGRLIERTFKEKDKPNHSSLRSKEIFSKTFDEVLSVSPPVMSNTREFFRGKLKEALPGLNDDDAQFRAYLVFSFMVDNDGGRATPRQVISFINELTSFYVLHGGQIALPTVAVYLAVQDKLEANPRELSKGAVIDERLRSIGADKELERNLAALLFNVEPELAFQLLLDNEIKAALVANTSSLLLDISKAPGFDDRINEVITSNAKEWQSGGIFSSVINNISDILQIHQGDSVEHLRKILAQQFRSLDTIHLGRETSKYLKLFNVCAQSELPSVVEHLIAAIVNSYESENLNETNGQEFSRFISTTHDALEKLNGVSLLDTVIKQTKLPSHPEFIFGFASQNLHTTVSIEKFANPTLDLSLNPGFLEAVSLEKPYEAVAAFAQFKAASMLTDDQWVSIGNTLLTSLSEKSFEDYETFEGQVTLLCDVWTYVEVLKRAKIDLSKLYASSSYYEELYGAFSEDMGNDALAHAIVLAAGLHFAGGLSAPTKVNSSGTRTLNSTEFDWFIQIMNGTTNLETEQYTTIAEHAARSFRMWAWLNYGGNHPENILVTNTIRAGFELEQLPWLSTAALMNNYNYLKDILAASFEKALPRVSSFIHTEGLAKLTYDEIPVGILRDTAKYADNSWRVLHDRANEILDNIPISEWEGHLGAADRICELLIEKIGSSGYITKDPEFRKMLSKFFLNILDGSVTPEREGFDYDPLLKTMDQGYHSNFFREMRENLRTESSNTLAIASRSFPKLLSNILQSTDRINKISKDNIVRYILLPAVEGNITIVLDIFLLIGRSKLSDFIKNSEESTQNMLEPALKQFADFPDRDYVLKIGELVHGKKAAKSWFSFIWPSLPSAKK